MSFNPFSNIHARRALTYATNRATVAKLVGDGVAQADSPFAASSVWGLPDGQTGSVNYDPSKVAAELAAYKQETGQKSLDFTLNSTADSDTLRIDQQLQAQWKAAGITAHIKSADQAALIKQLVAGELQTVILRIFNYPDPDNDFVFWSSKSVSGVGGININFNLYKSAQMDAGSRHRAGQQLPEQAQGRLRRPGAHGQCRRAQRLALPHALHPDRQHEAARAQHRPRRRFRQLRTQDVVRAISG